MSIFTTWREVKVKSSQKKLLLLKLLLYLGIIVFVYLLGYLTSVYKFFPQSHIENARTMIGRSIQSNILPRNKIPTIFLTLDVTRQDVKVTREGSGGGLTSVKDEVLLLTHEGKLFRVSRNGVRATSIEAPENGLEAYRIAANSKKYKHLNHTFSHFRFNDILYFSENNRHGLVVSFTEWIPDRECYGNTLALLELPHTMRSILDVTAAKTDWKVIYRTQPCLRLKQTNRALEGMGAGGRIDYMAPEKVILASGDYRLDGVYAPDAIAQKSGYDYGKVLEVDINTRIVRTLSLGHRNPQGLLVDDNNQIWSTEHGSRGGDELNLIKPGENYGWPLETLGTRYNKLPWPTVGEYGRHDIHTSPVYSWVPSVAVSNITQIANFHPAWNGDLLVSTLKQKTLYRLRIRDNRVLFAEPILIDERVRYAHQHTDGSIVLWTDNKKLLFLTLSQQSNTDILIDAMIKDSQLNKSQMTKLEATMDDCRKCHSFETYGHTEAPALGAIHGSKIASTAYAFYSATLQLKRGSWTTDELSQFLSSPQEYAPGTTMPGIGVNDPEVIKRIVTILETLKSRVD